MLQPRCGWFAAARPSLRPARVLPAEFFQHFSAKPFSDSSEFMGTAAAARVVMGRRSDDDDIVANHICSPADGFGHGPSGASRAGGWRHEPRKRKKKPVAITGPASYVPTMNEFLAHWNQCNSALPPTKPLLVRLPLTDTTVARADFLAQREALVTQQGVVQSRLQDLQLARGTILLQKTALLERFNQFITALEAYYQNTKFLLARPYAPGISYGQETFSRPMGDAMKLWGKMNLAPAPAGLTLPLTLKGGYTHGEFASAISALQFAYGEEQDKEQDVILERGNRDELQDDIYLVLKCYRETVPKKLEEFPVLVETMPRLTPLPGHTPDAVNASAIFVAPNFSKVVYDASTDSMLHSYQLRGNVGDDYSDEDAVVIATNAPGAPREFVVPFGLNQPGAKVALKVYVTLTTGNEAGSAAMFVERPMSLPQAA
jgi:hypothetical protein